MSLVIATPDCVLQKNAQFHEEQHDVINVFLRMWDGKTLCCTVDPKQAAITKINYLTQKVLQQYPCDSERNFFFEIQGKPLSPETCDSIMWNNGATVFVQYRNKGGCFMISLSILTIICAAIIGSPCTCGLSLFLVPILLPFLFVLPFFLL